MLKGAPMNENPEILKMNLERFRRLLQVDPVRRRTIEDLIRNNEITLESWTLSEGTQVPSAVVG
jgi:hypothetical protein